MRFIWRMAVRETRASWRRLLFFFLCIAIGVGTIASLRSIIQNVRNVMTGQARTLIAADLLVSAGQAFTPAQRHTLDARFAQASVSTRTESVETPTMVRPADPSKPVARMVELRAVQSAFPLYGQLELRDATYTPRLLANQGVLVRPELLTQLGVAVGEQLVIGKATFTIRGVIENEPGRQVGGLSLGPRVIIAYDDLAATQLLSFGSRARHQIMVRVPEARLAALTRDLKSDFKSAFVSVRSYRSTEDDIGEDMQRAENYLSLVGLAVVILGGIGISSVTRVFIQQKLKSIAVLKCVGAGTLQVIAVYVVQVLLLGVGGSLAGLALGRAALAAAPDRVGSSGASLALSHSLSTGAMAQAFGIGVLVSILFSLVPLLAVRHVRPSLLLRDESQPGIGRDWVRILAIVLVAGGVVLLAAWQASSVRVALFVCGGFVAVMAVLLVTAAGLVRATRPLAASRVFAVRHAVRHLSRPGNQTRVVLLAVGLGAFFIFAIRGVQGNLLREFSFELNDRLPDMFLIDVQEDQLAGVRALVNGHTGQTPLLIPVLRARVTQVRGKQTTLETVDAIRGQGSLAREYTITYRPALSSNERVIAGRFWDGTPSPVAEVSIERSLHERFKIDVGDSVRFDVLGQPITAKVTSIRDVNWRDARSGGFMFVFRPGVLEQAPHGYIAPLRGPASVDARARFQRDLVAAYPNVSVIDVREVIETARRVIGNVTLGISVVGGVVVFTGVLILVGAVAMTKYRRIHEAAVLKTLGASSRLVGSVLVIEYGLLGLLAGIVGALTGAALGWGLSRWVIHVPWHAPVADTAAGIAATTVLVGVVGLVSSLDVLRRKPLSTLRAE
jgi:putative ABC transport system permease protein